MFAKLARQQSKLARKLNFVQRRTTVKSLKNVYSEGSAANTEETVAALRQSLGQKEEYVSKYPDQTFEDYEEQMKAELSRPIFWDETFVNSVSDLLGYKKEEVRMACNNEIPEITKPAELKIYENAQDIDWDVAKKLYSLSKVRDTEISLLAKNYKKLRSFVAENKSIQNFQVDWKEWEQKLDKEAVAEVKKDADTVSQLYPRADTKKIVATVNEYFNPLLERMKDKLFDDLPTLKEVSETLEKETPLMKVDEHGMPVVMMSSPEFLDEYFPEIRDRIIEEIEISWFDTYYRDDRKKLKLTPDILLTYNNDWKKRETEKLDEQFKHELTVASSVTAEAKAFQQMYLDVTTIAKRNAELEAEVSQLRAQIEAQQEEATKKDGDGKDDVKATKQKKDLPPEIDKILMKHAQSNKTAVKEFPGVKRKEQPAQSQESSEAAH